MAEPQTCSIEVQFGAPVRLSSNHQQRLVSLISEICDAYEQENPDRVMWPAGIGDKPMSNWLAVEDGEMEFDGSVFQIECCERERYELEVLQKTQSYEFHVLNDALNRIGWPEIHKFQEELRKGQAVDEDAGGFMLRCIKRLFRIKRRDPVLTFQEAARSMLSEQLELAGQGTPHE